MDDQYQPWDNLDLERWFRKPKGHERRIHGHKHTGMRLVQTGATLLLVLDAHEGRRRPFSAEDLLPYRDAELPADEREVLQRRKVMRKARSPKNGRCSYQSSSKPLARQFGSGLPTPAHRLLDKRADLDQHSADLPQGQGAWRHRVTSSNADPVSRRKKAPKRFPFSGARARASDRTS